MLVTDRRRRMMSSNSSSSSSTGKRKRRRNNNILEISDYDVFLGKHLFHFSSLFHTTLFTTYLVFIYVLTLIDE